MGEKDFEQKVLVKAVDAALQEAGAELHVATPGGRFHVRWDEGGSATALGQLPFFAEFLEVTRLFARCKSLSVFSASFDTSVSSLTKCWCPFFSAYLTLVRYIVSKIIAARPKNLTPLGLSPPCLAFGTG